MGIICGPGSFAVLGSFADPYIPGELEVGPLVVESSVDAPVVDGSEVGVAVDDDPVEDGVSEVEYGVVVEPIEASAVVGESSVTRHTSKSSVSVAKKPTTRYVLLPFLDWARIPIVC